MTWRLPHIFDTSAMVDLFGGHRELALLLDKAEREALQVLLPTTAMAEAEASLDAGFNGWAAVLLTRGVRSLPLAEHVAIDVGTWPGSLGARHSTHEAAAVRGLVVTCDPGAYKGLSVRLLVV
jgi:hypothetical protein